MCLWAITGEKSCTVVLNDIECWSMAIRLILRIDHGNKMIIRADHGY